MAFVRLGGPRVLTIPWMESGFKGWLKHIVDFSPVATFQCSFQQTSRAWKVLTIHFRGSKVAWVSSRDPEVGADRNISKHLSVHLRTEAVLGTGVDLSNLRNWNLGNLHNILITKR